MENTFAKIILLLAITTLLFTHTVSAIWCYECNSNVKTEESCKEVLPDHNFLIDCAAKKYGARYNLCRTIRQWVDFEVETLGKDERVIRTCGKNQTGERECYYKAGYGARQRVCTCYTDGCNTASRHAFTTTWSLLAVTVIVAACLRHFFTTW